MAFETSLAAAFRSGRRVDFSMDALLRICIKGTLPPSDLSGSKRICRTTTGIRSPLKQLQDGQIVLSANLPYRAVHTNIA